MARKSAWPDGPLGRMLAAARCVGFDVFDTAVLRCVPHPHDVFDLAQRLYELEHGPLGFALRPLRVEAEDRARREAWERHGAREVDLAAVTRCLGEIAKVPAGVLEELALAEVAAEKACCVPNRPVLDLFRRLDRPVVFISDMYLPRGVVADILSAAGFGPTPRVYLSSELGRTKAEGGLFRLVLEDLGLQPGELLHLGDNPESDGRVPRSLGIAAHHLPRPLDTPGPGREMALLFGVDPAADADRRPDAPDARGGAGGEGPGASPAPRRPELVPEKTLTRRLLLSLNVNRRHAPDARQPPDSPELWRAMGYRSFGPALFAFTGWLARSFERHGIRRAFFLSRDGHFLKELYELHRAARPGACVETAYLLASRRCLNIAALDRLDDEALDFLVSGTSRLRVGEFLLRAGLDPAEHRRAVARAGLAGTGAVVAMGEDYARLRRLFTDLSGPLLAVAEREREPLSAYLDRMGVFSDEPTAVVDVGWHGTLQASLTRLAAILGRPTGLRGYYLGTFQAAASRAGRMPVASFLCRVGRPRRTVAAIQQGVELLETALAAPHRSLVRFEPGPDGAARPVFEGADDPAEGHDPYPLAHHLQEGARAFNEDMLPLARDLELRLSPRLALEPLARLFSRPTPAEARAFGDVWHAEGFGTVCRWRPIARPPSPWRLLAGPSAVRRAYEEAHWKAGFARRAPCFGWLRRLLRF